MMDVAGEWNRRADYEPLVQAPPDKLSARLKASALNLHDAVEGSVLKSDVADAGPTPFAGRNKGVDRNEF